jgi:hypothetical protein
MMRGVVSKKGPEQPKQFADDDDLVGEEMDDSCSCPFCGSQYADCHHFLGSRDLHFSGDFSVNDDGRLAELGESFAELGEAVTRFIEAGATARIALKPQRLSDLVQAVIDGEDNRGFTAYIERVGRDTRILVKAYSREDGYAPGFSSIVRMYWAEDVTAALKGMQKRVSQDIHRLIRPA